MTDQPRYGTSESPPGHAELRLQTAPRPLILLVMTAGGLEIVAGWDSFHARKFAAQILDLAADLDRRDLDSGRPKDENQN